MEGGAADTVDTSCDTSFDASCDTSCDAGTEEGAGRFDELVELTGLDGFNDPGVDRLGADFEPDLERGHQMLADLQRGPQLGCRRRCRRQSVPVGQGRGCAACLGR